MLLNAPENFLLFSPLLPEAASGTIEPRHAVIPLRELLERTDLLIGTVTDLDIKERTASAIDVNGDEHKIDFKVAILSPGSIPRYFPFPASWRTRLASRLSPMHMARNRVLHQLDAADAAQDPEERKRLLTFTFVGGGYAGRRSHR